MVKYVLLYLILESLSTRFFEACMASEENYSRARTVLCPRFLYYLHVSLVEKRSLSSSSLSSSSSSSSFPFAQKSIRRRLDRVLLSVQILASRVHTILMACVFVPANVGVFSLRSSILDVEPIYTFRGHRCVVSFYLSRECYVEKGSVKSWPFALHGEVQDFFLLLQVHRPCPKQAHRGITVQQSSSL